MRNTRQEQNNEDNVENPGHTNKVSKFFIRFKILTYMTLITTTTTTTTTDYVIYSHNKYAYIHIYMFMQDPY